MPTAKKRQPPVATFNDSNPLTLEETKQLITKVLMQLTLHEEDTNLLVLLIHCLTNETDRHNRERFSMHADNVSAPYLEGFEPMIEQAKRKTIAALRSGRE